ncbi:MAG: type II toxin-antitoxin system Phd/YefM family antitoxin [Candidatus Omnitrophota bacterium]|jgi:prevent-host-death family protein|nr:MAG: type II toxin-antitoxin system Phd/YefM family antitoxin [Candidatus Omnitrophota bacterium]
MKLSEAIKPISYFKAHASEVLREVTDNNKTMILTQNGEAKAVLQDIRTYEQTLASLALLKILALSNKNLNEGHMKPAEQSFQDIRARIDRANVR